MNMDWFGLGMSGGSLVIVAILIIASVRSGKLAQIYQNVIYMSMMVTSLFSVVVGALRLAGLGSIILPLTSLVAAGVIGIAGIYSERSKPFKGLVSPLNLSAISAFFIAMSIIGLGVTIGLQPFIHAQEAAVLAAAAGVADTAKESAARALQLLLFPLFAGALTVVANFASRDASSEPTA